MDSKLVYGIINKKSKEIISVATAIDMVDYLELLQAIKGKYDHVKLISSLSTYGYKL